MALNLKGLISNIETQFSALTQLPSAVMKATKAKKTAEAVKLNLSGLIKQPMVTTREAEGFPFPDEKEYKAGDRIRADLKLANNTNIIQKIPITITLISPKGKRIVTPQTTETLQPRQSMFYGVEAQQLPEDAEKGQWQFVANAGGKETKGNFLVGLPQLNNVGDISLGGFFGDVAKTFNIVKPQPFVTPETPIIKISTAVKDDIKRITEDAFQSPLVKNILPTQLTRTPQETEAIKKSFIDNPVTISEVLKGIANIAIEFPVVKMFSPAAFIRYGLTGQQLITGKSPGVGTIGFKDTRIFSPALIGSYQDIYNDEIKKGVSPYSAGWKVGLMFSFDSLMNVGAGTKLLPQARLVVNQLPESFLMKAEKVNISPEEVLGTLRGTNVTEKGNDFLKNLAPDEKKAIFNVARNYPNTAVEKVIQTPTALGEFAGRGQVEGIVSGKKELPGTAIVGKPQPAMGFTIQPIKKVGGVPEGAKDIQPFVQKMEIKPLEQAIKKFDETGSVTIAEEKTRGLRLATKDEGEFVSVGIDAGAGKLLPTDIELPSRNFATKEEAFDFIRSLSKQKLLTEPAIPKELQPLAQEARKYKSAEEFVNSPQVTDFIRTKANELNKEADALVIRRKQISELGTIEGTPRATKENRRLIEVSEKIDKRLAQISKEKLNLDSQLTDFYNQAVKGAEVKPEIPAKPPIEPTKPVLPAEVPPIKRPPSLEKLGLEEKPPLIERREDVLLRERLRAEARGANTAVAQYKRETAFLESISNQITRELNKPKGLQRSAISFVKQLGEFNQTVINEIKAELGIEKPLTGMNLEELKDFTTKLKERLKFKFEKGYQPSIETKEKLNLKESPKPILNEVDYEKNRQIMKETKPTIKKRIIKVGEKTVEVTGKILTPISTRLENIDPSLKYAMRKFEFDAMNSIQNSKKAVEPYLKKTKTGLFKKMSKDDFADLDLALKNGDIEKINEINKKYKIEKEFNEVKKTLDDIYRKANEVGFDIGYQKDYWPRMIKDTEGFLEYFGKQEYWSILDEAIKRKEMDLGRYLTNEEKANLINIMIRGYQGGQITLSGTGAMKNRVIDLVTPEINRFYYNSPTSLVKYIEEINDKIAARKFFGKGNKAEGFNNVEDSIGAYTTDLLAKGKITPKQELELRNILNARFNPKGTHGIVGLYKNLSYMDVMGSFLNAVTQLGDQAWAIYRGGLWRTVKSDIKAILGKSEITKESLGIEANKVAQEFSDAGKTARAVDKLFTLTGLNKIDRLGKEALVNGAIGKYQKLAEEPTMDFLKMIDNIFGKESEKVLAELRSGEITENVKLLAFNELLDFHPVALSEMPESYLKAGNGRIFYMLKSYTLKQFDIFRREAFREIKKGNWWKGTRNLLYLSTLVIITNGVADEIKDLLTNRKTKLSDRVIDQLAMLAGFSRYNLGKISEIGLGSALVEQIIPPTNFIDNLSKDLLNLYKDFDKSADINQLKTIQDIPLIGKFYYWWFGKGAETTKKYAPKGIQIPSISIPSISSVPSIKIPSIKL